jgi:hypothetical protein
MYKFADDTTLLYSSPAWGAKAALARKEMARLISKDLRNIHGWMQKWKMEVSAEKSQAMLLTRNKSLCHTAPPEIHYAGNKIPYATSIRLLGVHFSNNLIWDTHIEQMLVSANRARFSLGKLRGIASEQDMLTYYKAVVRPLLEYCSPLFAGASASSLATLDRFEQHCLNMIIRDPSRSANAKAEMDSIATRRTVGALTYLAKAVANKTPLPVKTVAPHFEKTKQTVRRSKRLLDREESKLEYDDCRPKYALRSGINFATKMFNELPSMTRRDLRQNIEDKAVVQCKRLVVDVVRGKETSAPGRPKRIVFAHDPHSETGPPTRCVHPPRMTLK